MVEDEEVPGEGSPVQQQAQGQVSIFFLVGSISISHPSPQSLIMYQNYNIINYKDDLEK